MNYEIRVFPFIPHNSDFLPSSGRIGGKWVTALFSDVELAETQGSLMKLTE
jgi:hypothetical protein